MSTGTMATAAGAVLLYYMLNRRSIPRGKDELDQNGDFSCVPSDGRRIARGPTQAPTTWLETLTTLSETLKFTYSETLGKWPIGDLAFGINHLMRKQGNLHVADVYASSHCLQLKGPDIAAELKNLLRLLMLCLYFSKKQFPAFLESSGYSQGDVLIQMPKAGLLKPAFTIIRDTNSECFYLLIRGTHSIKDTLTAATGAVVPFHHSVLDDGGISNLVLGYAHCGMVAAARWISKLCTPCLLDALNEYPNHKLKIIGHSLGGGTAALLTYILREHEKFSSSTCVTFAPAACMTWDLAESGRHFVTSVINGFDLVPTFSAASVDDLRSEVTASAWRSEFRDQVEQTRVLSIVYRSASALGSRLPSISSAKARVAVAGSLLRPVSSRTQGVVRQARSVAEAVIRKHSSFSSWSCMGPRRRTPSHPSSSETSHLQVEEVEVEEEEEAPSAASSSETMMVQEKLQCSKVVTLNDSDEEAIAAAPAAVDVAEGELWYQLEEEMSKTSEKEDVLEAETIPLTGGRGEPQSSSSSCISDRSQSHRFYPPGRILHIVSSSSSADVADDVADVAGPVDQVGLYENPRELYSKIRLSKTMIKDHYMPVYQFMMELLIDRLMSQL